MRQLGVERVGIRIDRSGLNPFADLKLLGSYRRRLKRLSPAAYLGYTIKPNIYGSIAAASLKIPAIPNVSGLGTTFMRRGPLRQIAIVLYRAAFRRAAIVFFQNPEDRQLFVDLRIVAADRARLVPGSGIDLDRFQLAPFPASGPVFLLIGRLLERQGRAGVCRGFAARTNGIPRCPIPAAWADRRRQSQRNQCCRASFLGRRGVCRISWRDRRRTPVHRRGERDRPPFLPRRPATIAAGRSSHGPPVDRR